MGIICLSKTAMGLKVNLST